MLDPSTADPCDAIDAADTRWMRHALAVGRRARGRAHPNPPVGAVLARPDELLPKAPRLSPAVRAQDVEVRLGMERDAAEQDLAEYLSRARNGFA